MALHEVARVDNGSATWECWASHADPIPSKEQRLVPMGLFVALDPRIGELLDLEVGQWATRAQDATAWERWAG